MSRLPSPPPEPSLPPARKETDVNVVDNRIPIAAQAPAPAAERAAASAGTASAGVARTSGGPRDPEVRLAALFDSGSLVLLTPADASGVLAGVGAIDGMTAVAFASDPRIQGGAMGADGCAAVVTAYDYAIETGAPVIGLWHSGGARLREGVESLHAVGTVFAAMTRASGVVPQISVVLGAAAGGAAYGPALTDLVILSDKGRIFVTGPDVVLSVTGEDVDMERLGGPEPHSRRSGVVHLVTATDAEALSAARRLALLLGQQGVMPATFSGHPATAPAPGPVSAAGNGAAGNGAAGELTHASLADTDLAALLPESPRHAYDVHPLISGLLEGPGRELHPRWAPNVVTTLGRLAGRTVGVIANNPLRLGGCLDATSAEKAARFVRMCDAFGVPLVVVVDVPGYLPGVGQEWDGVVRRGAKLLHAFAEATVPRVTLVTRKAYGGAYIAMNSRALGATRVFAWPDAKVAVMGAFAAVRILHRRTLAEVPADQLHEAETRLAEEHQREAGGLHRAVELGVVDEIIEPAKTRQAIVRAIAAVPPARGRHGNIPL